MLHIHILESKLVNTQDIQRILIANQLINVLTLILQHLKINIYSFSTRKMPIIIDVVGLARTRIIFTFCFRNACCTTYTLNLPSVALLIQFTRIHL